MIEDIQTIKAELKDPLRKLIESGHNWCDIFEFFLNEIGDHIKQIVKTDELDDRVICFNLSQDHRLYIKETLINIVSDKLNRYIGTEF